MSSALLYLAIVAVWAVVLVPAWLRHDPQENAEQLEDEQFTGHADDVVDDAQPDDPHTAEPQPAPAPRVTGARQRARIIARRRRRTTALLALVLGTVPLPFVGIVPWWFAAPPLVLLAGHMALLRTAARADAEREAAVRRAELARRRRAQLFAEQRAAQLEEAGQVIELGARTEEDEQIYDQYTDAELRAAGE